MQDTRPTPWAPTGTPGALMNRTRAAGGDGALAGGRSALQLPSTKAVLHG